MEINRISEAGRCCYKWRILSVTALKLIAVVLMFLDHIHQMFAAVGAPMWLTAAGRLVFPMFLFAASESFYYTHSKKGYLKRLLFASWGMTFFTFILQWAVPHEGVVLINNAFSTFFVTGLYMLFWDWFKEGIRHKSLRKIIKAFLCCFIPVISALPIYLVALLSFQENVPASAIRLLASVALLIPNILTVEGGFSLVVIGVLFYVFRKRRTLQIAILLLLSTVVYLAGDSIQCFMGFAAIPIALYNGERGKGMKNFFYIFYPVHIGLLYIISAFIV